MSDIDEIKKNVARILLAVEGDPADERRPGLRMDVDRLKRTVALQVKAFWLLLTATVGVLAERIFHK